MKLVKVGKLEMLVPKSTRESRRSMLKQNLIDALLEKHRETPHITYEELEIYAHGYLRGKIKRHERGYRVD